MTPNGTIKTNGFSKLSWLQRFGFGSGDPTNPTQMNEQYQYDWLHPNANGYKAMGEEAAKVLSQQQ